MTTDPDITRTQKEPPLIAHALEDQQNLTAVDLFSDWHEGNGHPEDRDTWKALLPGSSPGVGQQYAFEVDLDSCSGCKACVTGCHNQNGLDADEAWRSVGLLQMVSTFPLRSEAPSFLQHVTTACHHCLEPACLSGCPVIAYEKDPFTGIVKHLDDQCIGCQYCLFKCPYGVPQFNKSKGIVRKCDMCTDRLAVGEAPACVQSCPNEAIKITVVDKEKIEQQPFSIPGAPDPAYTQPTTRYTSRNAVPTEAAPSDAADLSLQPSEWPLAVMLVLTQASVGVLLGGLAAPSGMALLLLATLLGGLGLAIAPLHLGRPQFGFRAFLGWRTSWLSREAIVLGGYQGMLSLACVLGVLPLIFSLSEPETGLLFLDSWIQQLTRLPFLNNGIQQLNHLPLVGSLFHPPGWLVTGLGWTAFALGIQGIFCSAMVYIDTPRTWWRSKMTLVKFTLTGLMCGLAPVLAMPFTPRTMKGILLGSLFITSLLKITLELWPLIASRKPSHELRPVALLLRRLKPLLTVRLAAMFTAVVLLPGLWAGGLLPSAALTGIFPLILVGELLERLAFFKACAPPSMPGCIIKPTGNH